MEVCLLLLADKRAEVRPLLVCMLEPHALSARRQYNTRRVQMCDKANKLGPSVNQRACNGLVVSDC